MKTRKYTIICSIILLQCIMLIVVNAQKRAIKIASKISNLDYIYCSECSTGDSLKVDTASADLQNKKFVIQLNSTAAYSSFRERTVKDIKTNFRVYIPRRFQSWDISVIIDSLPLKNYIPNYYRDEVPIDNSRIYYKENTETSPLLSFNSRNQAKMGLQNKTIALWHSHGLYYDVNSSTWVWQRPPIYETIEDLFPMTFVLPYLAPMLENSGAITLIPRERDYNSNEVIVDNDKSTGGSTIETEGYSWSNIADGYLWKDTLYTGENPFKLGTYSRITASEEETSRIIYIPEIPETGEYSVYLSWKKDSNNISNAKYTIKYYGGSIDIDVNQKIGGGTWIYAGKYYFLKGKNEKIGSVSISNKSDQNGYLTTDAIRFGGGMGNVARCNQDSVWSVSNKARYLEGSRTYLQYSGIPEKVYSLHGNKNDYTDDYQSRGLWVNYMKDSLNIPIDMSFAFHTDAGIDLTNKIIGTLLIYSTDGDSAKLYKNGVSKFSNRDLADLVQTQIVSDVEKSFDIRWTNRGMWDKQYSEAKRSDVPTFLLELLSHQNFADAMWGQDPRFKFTVSRAVYKGILRFISNQENKPYVVQPLPIHNFRIDKYSDTQLHLTWEATSDSLEPTAKPNSYYLFTSKNEEGFDQGIFVSGTETSVVVDKESIYRFKVCAFNEGGLGFPSEILSAYMGGNNPKPVVIVNAFNRVSAPDNFSTPTLAGISYWGDKGVADKINIGYSGTQYDYNKNKYLDSVANQDWGASYTDDVGKILPGNSFDFTYTHGKSLKYNGYSYISMSKESFCNSTPSPENVLALDLIFGKEKCIYNFNDSLFKRPNFEIYTAKFRQSLEKFINEKGNVFLSGSYIGSEAQRNEESKEFIKNILHFTLSSGHASKNGKVRSESNPFISDCYKINFNIGENTKTYSVESPDALNPADKETSVILRYIENNKSAGVAYCGESKIISLGFPFETIDEIESRNLMCEIMKFLTSK